MSKKIRWGILSTGLIATKFAQTLCFLKENTVFEAVGSRTAESAQAFAEKFGANKAYASYEEVAQDPDVDIVYVGTPNNYHYENALMCLKAGKHVLVEKPFALNAAQAKEMFSYAKEHHLFIMEAFWTRFLPATQEILRLLSLGEIGEVLHFHGQFGFQTSTPARYARKMGAEFAGGSLLDVGLYCIGDALMFFGEKPTDIKATAVMGEYGTDRQCSVMLDFAGKKNALLSSGIGIVLPNQGSLYGTEGRIDFEETNSPQGFTLTKNDGSSKTYSLPFDFNGFEYEILECGRCIEEGRGESELHSSANTLEVLDILDEVRRQIGLTFPCE